MPLHIHCLGTQIWLRRGSFAQTLKRHPFLLIAENETPVQGFFLKNATR